MSDHSQHLRVPALPACSVVRLDSMGRLDARDIPCLELAESLPGECERPKLGFLFRPHEITRGSCQRVLFVGRFGFVVHGAGREESFERLRSSRPWIGGSGANRAIRYATEDSDLGAVPWPRRCRAWTSCSRAGILSARSSSCACAGTCATS